MREKVLFIAPELGPGAGGGGVVTSWMLQALTSAYTVTVITWGAPDLVALDRKFGTSLRETCITVVTPGRFAKKLVDAIPDSSSHQRSNYLLRMGKRISARFALLLACGFECDLGRPGIQYIHFPYVARRSANWTVPGDAPLPALLKGLLAGRTRTWMMISGYSFERMWSNLTLTNSHWTAQQIGDRATQLEVLYPPAPGTFRNVPWSERENAFVCTGRLVCDKRHRWIVETLALVRRDWPDLRLHICGSCPTEDYRRELCELQAANGSWVQVHYDLSREALVARLTASRYGIHAFLDEHFGIAVAEMACAGCIPFVHASGGQVEIVNADPRLCFATQEEAAAKILRVLRDPGLQTQLQASVHRSSERFTAEAFTCGLLDHTARFLARRQNGVAQEPMVV